MKESDKFASEKISLASTALQKAKKKKNRKKERVDDQFEGFDII